MKTKALLLRGVILLSLIVGCIFFVQPTYSQKFKKIKNKYPKFAWWKITYPNGNVGFSVNEKKNIVEDGARGYTSVGYFGNDLFWVKRGDYTGLVDMCGNEVVSPDIYIHIDCEYSTSYKYKYLQVGVGGSYYRPEKVGTLNMKGNVILPCKYKDIELGEESITLNHTTKYLSYFVGTSNDSCVMCDTTGIVTFASSEYSSLKPYFTTNPTSFDLASNIIAYAVCRDSKYGVCDKDGNLLLSPIYPYLWDISDEHGRLLVKFKVNDKMKVIDVLGNEVVPPMYDYVYLQREKDFNYFKVKLNNKVGICDENGLEIIPPIYDGIAYFDGKFRNFVNGKFAEVIDVDRYANPEEKITLENGKLVLSYKGKVFSWHPYDELVWVVEKNRYYGSLYGYSTYIDLTGKEENSIAKCVFEEAYEVPIDNFEDKLMLYTKVVELDSNNREGYKAMALNNIGVMYESLGDENTALAYYDKAALLGNSYGINNARNIREAHAAAQRAERAQRISNALTQISNSLSAISSTLNQNGSNHVNHTNQTHSSGGKSSGGNVGHTSRCTKCGGSGSCSKCGGDGLVLGKISQEFEPCSSCNFRGNSPKSKIGKCTYCGGTGKK